MNDPRSIDSIMILFACCCGYVSVPKFVGFKEHNDVIVSGILTKFENGELL
jgi:hypothetical protein